MPPVAESCLCEVEPSSHLIALRDHTLAPFSTQPTRIIPIPRIWLPLACRGLLSNPGKTGPDMTSGPPPHHSPSPSASFYAMSDDEESDYNTVTHSKSGRGVKLLYSKSKVRFSI